ncbi:hypothetical protein RJT34_25544 [Clitoria ternatea]|uniref:Uncharacterized protein n=1 Tax=Clitoria ternatea TaxID=43366 RepID=A0AAN9IK33_CLITE
MWFAGGKRSLLYVCVVVLLVTRVLEVCHTCQVGAIRVTPENAVANMKLSKGNMMNNKRNKEDLFNKYFGGTTLAPNNTTFDESKRRVPSCPDPLHN